VLPEARRSARLLALSWAVSWIAVPISGAFGSGIVRELTHDLSLTGVPFFLFYLGSLLSAYPAGRLMDRYGRRPVLVAGHVVAAVGFTVGTLAILAQSLWLFFVGQFIGALGTGATYLTRLAAADLYPASERARGLGRLVASLVAGAALAVPVIWLAERAQTRIGGSYLALAWGVIPPISLAAAFIVSRIHPDPMQTALAYRDQEAATPAARTPLLAPTHRRRTLVAAAASLLFAQAAMAAVMSVSGASLQAHGHGPDFIILTLTLHVVGMFGFSPLVGVLGDRFGRKVLLSISAAYLVGSTLLVRLLPNGMALMVGLVLVGIGWSFAFIGANAIVADLSAVTHRGRILGTIDVGTAIIGASASLLAGWALQRGGLPDVGLVGFAFAVGLSIAALLLPTQAVKPLAAPVHDVAQ
jgi:MFS family permease